MKKNVVIVFLILIIVGLTSYIVYDKLIINEKSSQSQNETNETLPEIEKNDESKEQETTKYDLSNTLFSEINEENFSYLTISINDSNTCVSGETKTITKYNEVEELIYNIAMEDHKTIEAGGVGCGDIALYIEYYTSNKRKAISIHSGIMSFMVENQFTVSYTNDYSDITLNLISKLYDRY